METMEESRETQSGFPLLLARNGDVVEVLRCRTTEKSRSRLADMGIKTGSRLKVLQAGERNGVIVICGDSRIGLDGHLASSLIVAPCLAEEDCVSGTGESCHWLSCGKNCEKKMSFFRKWMG